MLEFLRYLFRNLFIPLDIFQVGIISGFSVILCQWIEDRASLVSIQPGKVAQGLLSIGL